jgi:hypothetical protein
MGQRGPTIAEIALGVIRELGPQALDVLVRVVVAAGRTRAKDPRRAVSAAIAGSPEFLEAWDGRWCSIVEQLDGAMFTTPVSGLERRDGVVVLRDHLALVEKLAARPRPVAGGGDVHLHLFEDYFDLPWPTDDLDDGSLRELLGSELADDLLGFLIELGLPTDADEDETLREFLWEMQLVRVLDGPPGWFPVLAPGQLLGIRIRSGMIEALAVDRRDVTGPHVGIVGAQIAGLARLVIGPDPSWFGPPVIPLEELLELVATEKAELLHRPLPPFPEVLARGGLELHEGWVGHRGTDWEAAGLLARLSPEEAWGFQPSRMEH